MPWVAFCKIGLCAALLIAMHPIARASEPDAADAEFFEKEIRPLLIERCHKCHGDLPEPKGQLKLTSREAILKGGETGPAAVAGKPGESLLISAVKYDGIEMPPEGDKLSKVEVARLTRWVERGLPWPKTDPRVLTAAQTAAESEQISRVRGSFWSFQPVRNPPLPALSNAAWPKTAIDRFVLAELEKKGLSPSPPADRRTLLRRLTFDLVGLPPTPEETDAFLRDDSPDALSRVVDRLLASPGYGERWGRHWLDVARYADTKGYVLFQDGNFPWSYTYRDYVVRSLNEDLPYDRFIVEQLAADHLPLTTDKRPLTALGFLTLGSGFMNNKQDVIDDRVDVVTRGLLGLTVSCARCHDHKFDPIPTRDYYSLYGVFASSAEPTVPPLFEEPPQTEAYAAFAKELADRERKLSDFHGAKFDELIAGARSRIGEYLLAANGLKDKPPTEEFMLLTDTNDLNPTMIIRYQVYLAESRKRHDPVLALWHALAEISEDQFSSQAGPVVETLLSEPAQDKGINPLVAGAFLGKPLKEIADAAKIYGDLLAGVDKVWQAALQTARAASQATPTGLSDANLESLRQVLYGPESPASLARGSINELMLLPDRASQKVRTDLLKAIEDWRASGPAAPPRAMALVDLAEPVTSRVFLRGNSTQLGDEVPRQFLRVLSSSEPVAFQHGSGRLDLALAIADRNNPLTARVLVNRVWLEHFGSALVATPSDFGLRSLPPTHPQLLDYLAWQFMEHGWSLKQLHREIVLSAVYQQSSDARADCQKVDPENALLWKMNRRRLDFEATRDALLSVAGRLEKCLGGPPIKNSNEPTATRRTIYSYIDRLNLPGVFRTFDFPNPDATSPQRTETTIPQQALFFLNNPLVLASAEHLLARSDVAAEQEASKKIGRLYQLLYGREPVPEELSTALQFLNEAASRPELWKQFAHALLSSNEFVFID